MAATVSFVLLALLFNKMSTVDCSEEGCLSRTMLYPDQKAHMAHCIASCMGLNNEATLSQKCYYHHRNGPPTIETPKKVDKSCPQIDCSSPIALKLKAAFSLIYDTTRLAKQKKACGRRLYYSKTENPVARGIHLCPCNIEKTQLWSAESIEKIKCVLENAPDSHKQKGVLLTAGYRTSSTPLAWCSGSKNKTDFTQISSFLDITSKASDEICLLLTFTPFRTGESTPNVFLLKEVPCDEGMYLMVCEGEIPV